MATIKQTAYPTLKRSYSDNELNQLFKPSNQELYWIRHSLKSNSARLVRLALLKTFQVLHYFPTHTSIPSSLILLLGESLSIDVSQHSKQAFQKNSHLNRHKTAILKHLNIQPYSKANDLALKLALDHASRKDPVVDIINAVIEELISLNIELPSFSALDRLALSARSQVNNRVFKCLYSNLNTDQKKTLSALWDVNDEDGTDWFRLKQEPKKPSFNHLRLYLTIVKWTDDLARKLPRLPYIPELKRKQWVQECMAYDADRMKSLKPTKRYALAVIFICERQYLMTDHLVWMLIRYMRTLENKAQADLDARASRFMEDAVYVSSVTKKAVHLLNDDALAWRSKEIKFQNIFSHPENILDRCSAIEKIKRADLYPFLVKRFRHSRSLIKQTIQALTIRSGSGDTVYLQALHSLWQRGKKTIFQRIS